MVGSWFCGCFSLAIRTLCFVFGSCSLTMYLLIWIQWWSLFLLCMFLLFLLWWWNFVLIIVPSYKIITKREFVRCLSRSWSCRLFFPYLWSAKFEWDVFPFPLCMPFYEGRRGLARIAALNTFVLKPFNWDGGRTLNLWLYGCLSRLILVMWIISMPCK